MKKSLFCYLLFLLSISCKNENNKEVRMNPTDTLNAMGESNQHTSNETDVDSFYSIKAIIDDKDGYTNVRGDASANGSVLTTVKDGEIFYVHLGDDLNTYWKVKTKNGIKGYMHQSRIASDDIEFNKWIISLAKDKRREYQEEDEKENAASKESNKNGELVMKAFGLDKIEDALNGKERKFNNTYNCKWCGKEFKAKNGWFHNTKLAQGDIGCMPINGYIYSGNPDYCSKKCCLSDN